MLKCHGGRCSWERLQRNGYFWCYFLSSSSEIGLYCAYFSSEGLKGTGKYYVSPRFFQEKRFPLLLLPQQSLPCATGVAAAEIQPSRHRGNAGFVHGHWHRWGWVKSTEICWGFMLKACKAKYPLQVWHRGALNVFVHFAVTLMETWSILKAITRSLVLFILWLQG